MGGRARLLPPSGCESRPGSGGGPLPRRQDPDHDEREDQEEEPENGEEHTASPCYRRSFRTNIAHTMAAEAQNIHIIQYQSPTTYLPIPNQLT